MRRWRGLKRQWWIHLGLLILRDPGACRGRCSINNQNMTLGLERGLGEMGWCGVVWPGGGGWRWVYTGRIRQEGKRALEDPGKHQVSDVRCGVGSRDLRKDEVSGGREWSQKPEDSVRVESRESNQIPETSQLKHTCRLDNHNSVTLATSVLDRVVKLSPSLYFF